MAQVDDFFLLYSESARNNIRCIMIMIFISFCFDEYLINIFVIIIHNIMVSDDSILLPAASDFATVI